AQVPRGRGRLHLTAVLARSGSLTRDVLVSSKAQRTPHGELVIVGRRKADRHLQQLGRSRGCSPRTCGTGCLLEGICNLRRGPRGGQREMSHALLVVQR